MSTEKTISGSWIVDEISKMHINSIPQAWYKTVRQKKAPHAMAILILWELLYWYKWTEIRDEQSDRVIGYKKKFKADLLQRSYGDIAEKFGITKRQATDILYFLRDKGIVTLDLRTVTANGMKISNVLFIGLNPKKIAEISDERNLIDTEESDSTNENSVKLSTEESDSTNENSGKLSTEESNSSNENSGKLSTEESNSSNEISLEGSQNSDRQIQSLTQTNSQTNTQSTSQSISSPQPAESSNKDSLPQEEISKSHCKQSSTPQSGNTVKQNLNSKSHCGKATESDEFKKQVQEIKLLYLNNYQTLYDKKLVTIDKPQITWNRAINKIKECLTNFGFDSVCKALNSALADNWIVKNGYVLTTILSDGCFPRLTQSANNQRSMRKQDSPPVIFDDTHLFF